MVLSTTIDDQGTTRRMCGDEGRRTKRRDQVNGGRREETEERKGITTSDTPKVLCKPNKPGRGRTLDLHTIVRRFASSLRSGHR